MRIGIYIGSFNPPHLGHKKVIDYLLDNHYVENILIIPTENSPAGEFFCWKIHNSQFIIHNERYCKL